MKEDPEIPLRFIGEWELKFSYFPVTVLDLTGLRRFFWRYYYRRIILRMDLDCCWYEKVSVSKYLDLTR